MRRGGSVASARALGSGVLALVALGMMPACDGQLRFDEPDASAAARDGGALGVDGAPSFPLDENDARGGVPAAPDATVPRPRRPPCRSDADCGHPQLHCERISGVCYPCLRDDDCKAQNLARCSPVNHRCMECATPLDCGPPALCERATHTCVPLCAEGIEACPAEYAACEERAGRCIDCVDDLGCTSSPRGRYCDRATMRCTECTTNGNCPAARPLCDRSRSRCVACLGASDCPADAPVCDPVSWACVAAR